MLMIGEEATMKQLGAVPMPLVTETYKPIPHDEYVDLVLNELVAADLDVRKATYGLNKDGRQMFGVIRCDVRGRDGETELCFGLRSSHDKSLSKGIVAGRSVMVCSNLMFSGEVGASRKHTGNIEDDLGEVVRNTIAKALYTLDHADAEITWMKNAQRSTDEGYRILGSALGNRKLTSVQASRAFQQWRSPSHEAFMPRTLWSLHNAGTEALKHGRVATAMQRHVDWHAFMVKNWSDNIFPGRDGSIPPQLAEDAPEQGE